MTPKQFQKFLDRDGGCLHCGRFPEAVPHHRANRGMGGSKQRDVPSNIIVLCSIVNGQLESDPIAARRAKIWGWKLESWQDPREVPVYDPRSGFWFKLDDNHGSTVSDPPFGTTVW
jgi:hypothetical protein